MLRFTGHRHLGRVWTREECVFYHRALVLMRLIPCPVVVRACWSPSSPRWCFYSGEKVQTRCEVLFRVVVALTGEWAVKPRGRRFMDHLVLPEVKGQGCTTCPPQHYSNVEANLEPRNMFLLTIEMWRLRRSIRMLLMWHINKPVKNRGKKICEEME